MITETEKNELQLAKKVFEHFTHDAFAMAREIIAMERDMGELTLNGEPQDGVPESILEVEKTGVNGFPEGDLSVIGIDDPAQPVKHMNEELEYQTKDDFPF